jgi:hypothetical protein
VRAYLACEEGDAICELWLKVQVRLLLQSKQKPQAIGKPPALAMSKGNSFLKGKGKQTVYINNTDYYFDQEGKGKGKGTGKGSNYNDGFVKGQGKQYGYVDDWHVEDYAGGKGQEQDQEQGREQEQERTIMEQERTINVFEYHCLRKAKAKAKARTVLQRAAEIREQYNVAAATGEDMGERFHVSILGLFSVICHLLILDLLLLTIFVLFVLFLRLKEM